MPSYQPERGDLVYVDCSPQAGTEQAGRRPALILSPRAFNVALGLAFACPITNQVSGSMFDVTLPPGSGVTGAVLVAHLRSFDWIARRMEFRARVPASFVDDVAARLAAIMGNPGGSPG